MKIELLYFEGCPNHESARQILRQSLDSLGRQDRIDEVQVCSQSEAEAIKFVGSPSVRINGSDVEPYARNAKVFGLSCRTYLHGSLHSGVPSRELVRGAIMEAIRESS